MYFTNWYAKVFSIKSHIAWFALRFRPDALLILNLELRFALQALYILTWQEFLTSMEDRNIRNKIFLWKYKCSRILKNFSLKVSVNLIKAWAVANCTACSAKLIKNTTIRQLWTRAFKWCIIIYIFDDVSNFEVDDVIKVYDVMQIITNVLGKREWPNLVLFIVVNNCKAF